jgi:hypothetical protein
MALSEWRPDEDHSWIEGVVPVFTPRKRLRLLTPLGWFAILSVMSVVTGATIGFLT